MKTVRRKLSLTHLGVSMLWSWIHQSRKLKQSFSFAIIRRVVCLPEEEFVITLHSRSQNSKTLLQELKSLVVQSHHYQQSVCQEESVLLTCTSSVESQKSGGVAIACHPKIQKKGWVCWNHLNYQCYQRRVKPWPWVLTWPHQAKAPCMNKEVVNTSMSLGPTSQRHQRSNNPSRNHRRACPRRISK